LTIVTRDAAGPAARLPPGPPLPSLLQAMLWAQWPLAFTAWCRRRYGSTFTLQMTVQGPTVVITDPELVRTMFTADPRSMEGAEKHSSLIVGERSLIVVDGDDHARARRLLTPLFQRKALAHHERLVAELVAAEVERWPLGRPFALMPRLRAVGLEVILRVVFGMEEPERLRRVRAALSALYRSASLWMLVPWLRVDLGPRSPWGRFLGLLAAADQVLLEEIDARRRDPRLPGRDDVLSRLLLARDDEERPLDDGELRDHLVTVLSAGHQPTAASLAWCFDLLLRDRDAMARLEAEANEGGHAYCDAVLRETLRLRPIFPFVLRRLRTPLALDGRVVPAGVTLAADSVLVQRRPEAYEDPDAFRPERFLAAPPSGGAWVAFGGGSRRCLGATFAPWEMRVMLATIVRRARLRPARRRLERPVLRSTRLSPRHGTLVVLEERRP
jgi:cytochrome P450 family 135